MWNKLRKNPVNKEQGFTLVEILVAIGLFIFVATAITVTVVMLSNSTSKFATSSMTQNQAADAISEMTRDISSATAFSYADDYRVSFLSAQDNKTYEVSYFYWNSADDYQVSVPPGVNTADLPTNTPSIIQFRREQGVAQGTTKTVVEGYSIYQQDRPLFTYYNKANATMETPIVNDQLQDITRVDYGFLLKIDGRKGMVELASAATPRYAATNIDNGGDVTPTGTCPTPTLVGSLQANTTTAKLAWTQTQGANTYTLYRMNDKQAVNPMVVAVINGYATTNYDDSTVEWGETYQYFVVAGCAVGTSDASNLVPLRVTPDQPMIVNVNKTGHKTLTELQTKTTETGTINPKKDTTYTVARGFRNQITWTKMNGADGYRIIRKAQGQSDAEAVVLVTINNPQATSYQDTGKTYGDVYEYKVIAYNNTINGSGGDSVPSGEQELISPPLESTYTIIRPDNSTRSSTTDNVVTITNRAANTDGYRIYRSSTLAAQGICPVAQNPADLLKDSPMATNQITDSSAEWGSWTCYLMQPYNDAGDGPTQTNEDGVIAKQYPGRFSILGISSTRYQQMNQAAGLPQAAACWTSFAVPGSTDYTCYEGNPIRGTNGIAPIGMFDSSVSDPRTTDITVSWSNAINAYGGYGLTQNRTETAGAVDQGDKNVYITANPSRPGDNLLKYTGSSVGVRIYAQMPGSTYTYTVTAYAANGEGRNQSGNHVSSPDVPSYAGVAREARSPYPQYRRRFEITPAPIRGNWDLTVGHLDIYGYGARDFTATPGNGGYQEWYSSEFNGPSEGEIYGYNQITRAGANTNYSAPVGANLWVNGRCGYACYSSWTTSPPGYPNYVNGNYIRYYAGGAAHGTRIDVLSGGQPAPTPTPPGPQDQKTDPQTFSCADVSEDDTNFLAWGCFPGMGIPGVTKQFTWDNQAAAVTTVSWQDDPFSTRYEVTVESSGGTSKTYNVIPNHSMNTQVYNVTVPYGQSTSITIKTVNNQGISPVSKAVLVNLPNAPIGVKMVKQTGNDYDLTWSITNFADEYRIVVTEDGVETNVYTTDTNNVTVSIDPTTTNASFTVQAVQTQFKAADGSFPMSKLSASATIR